MSSLWFWIIISLKSISEIGSVSLPFESPINQGLFSLSKFLCKFASMPSIEKFKRQMQTVIKPIAVKFCQNIQKLIGFFNSETTIYFQIEFYARVGQPLYKYRDEISRSRKCTDFFEFVFRNVSILEISSLFMPILYPCKSVGLSVGYFGNNQSVLGSIVVVYPRMAKVLCCANRCPRPNDLCLSFR